MIEEDYSVLGSASGLLKLNHEVKGWIRIAPCVLQFLDVSKGFVLKATHSNNVLLYSPVSSLKFTAVSNNVHQFVLPDSKEYRMEYEKVVDASNFSTLLGNATHEQQKFGGAIFDEMAARQVAGISQSGEVLDSLLNEFMISINNGDERKAAEIAQRLAAQKVPLALRQDVNTTAMSRKDDNISVRISVEDRFNSETKITLNVKPSISIRTLKEKMFSLYNFPPEVQRWIVGQRIVRDDETLKSLSVDSSGYMIYLYLVSAKSVGLKKDGSRKYSENDDVPLGSGTDQARGNTLPVTKPKTYPPPIPRPLRSPKTPVKMEEVVQFVKGWMGDPSGTTTSVPTSGKKTAMDVGWRCEGCTMVNVPRRPSCHMCSNPRPETYVLPSVDSYELDDVEKNLLDEEKKQQDILRQLEEEDRNAAVVNFERLQEYDQMDLIPNSEPFGCMICYCDYDVGEGITLRECLHSFCRDCLMGYIASSEEAEIRCPYKDDEFACDELLQDREIRALVNKDQYEKHLQRGLATAETQAENSFHCKSVDCQGWCIYEDDVNFFQCPICGESNCLTCKAIHEGKNCQEYQDEIRIAALNNKAANQTQMMLDDLVRKGDAMHCPKCKIIVQKKDGCDWVRCTMCKTEICWVTKGPRWGPNGKGDRTGGCHCRENGKLCHPNCQNCH